MTPIDDPVTFVVPGDLHLTEPGLDNHLSALKMIEDINAWICPDFVQFIGDNVQDATEDQFRLFDDLRSRLAVPHFALVGDHDVKDDPEARGFIGRFGSTFGSMSIRGFRFLRLDTQQSRPMGLWDAQVDWLASEVEQTIDTGERVLIFQHNYPFQVWENFDGPGVDGWRKIVQTRRISAIVCGHTHYWQVANDGRNVAVAVRSIGDPEGGPPGYLVGYLLNDDFAIIYRTIEDQGPLTLITHPRAKILATGPSHIVSGRDRVEARVWSKAGVNSAAGRIDGAEWFDLKNKSTGRWVAPLDGTRLTKGTHRLEIKAFEDDGMEGRQTIDFAVDPTGRYTAIPQAEPVVESTAFC